MVYIKRNSVVTDGEMIDTNHEKNVAFYNKRESKGLLVPKGVAPKKVVVEQIPRSETWVEPEPQQDNEEPDENGILPLPVSERNKKHWDAIVAERNASLLKVKEEKLRAEVIPSALIPPLIIQNNQNFVISFKNVVDEILTEFGKIKEFSTDEFAEMRGRLLAAINLGSKAATDMTLKQVKNIVKNYSDKKGVGERA